MTIESYTHVHHIVSNVSGELKGEVTPIGALRAVFPGGTITGCPKFRCMQIIAELEGAGRGAYTGSLGYLTHDGRLDLNILIRTMTLSAQQLTFRAGAGIVADSDPERELEETRAKARGAPGGTGRAAVMPGSSQPPPGQAVAQLVWVNGRAGREVSALERGLHFGDGLFETVAWVGRARFWSCTAAPRRRLRAPGARGSR